MWIVKIELLPYQIHTGEDGYLIHFCYKGYSSFGLKYMLCFFVCLFVLNGHGIKISNT